MTLRTHQRNEGRSVHEQRYSVAALNSTNDQIHAVTSVSIGFSVSSSFGTKLEQHNKQLASTREVLSCISTPKLAHKSSDEESCNYLSFGSPRHSWSRYVHRLALHYDVGKGFQGPCDGKLRHQLYVYAAGRGRVQGALDRTALECRITRNCMKL